MPFAPANISLIFETYDAKPPHPRGSLGVGITLTEGVRAEISTGKPGIYVGGKKWAFPTVAHVLAELTEEPLRLELSAAFGFGCGFGMSGASALAAAFAVNEWNAANGGRVRTREQLGMLAHQAEVAAATGLGDVGGQFNGGIMIKTRRYEPLTVELLPIPQQPLELHVRIFGPIHTADVIGSRERLLAINSAGKHALKQVAMAGATLTLEQLFDISLSFAAQSELLQSHKVRDAIDKIRRKGGHASMIMLGEAVVSTIPFPGSRAVQVYWGTPQG